MILLTSISVCVAASFAAATALAQEPAAPATQPPPTQAFPPPAQPQPAAQPQPQPQPYPAQPPPSQPSYPAPQGQTYPAQPQGAQPGYGYSQPYREPEPPPPPPSRPDDGFQRPELSIRIDPLNLLFESKLGIELETQLWHFISFEIVPTFVVSSRAPTLNYFSDFNSSLRQYSNGIGSLSGAMFDVAFWFSGTPFRDYGLRIGLSDYGYRYETSDALGVISSVKKTDRQFVVMLATMDRWGAFTLAGGIGIGYDLTKENRCYDPTLVTAGTPPAQAFSSNCRNPAYEMALSRTNPPDRVDLKTPLYPFDLLARISLGVTF